LADRDDKRTDREHLPNNIVIESAQPAVVWAPEIIDGVHGNARQQPVERRHCFERPRSVVCRHFAFPSYFPPKQ